MHLAVILLYIGLSPFPEDSVRVRSLRTLPQSTSSSLRDNSYLADASPLYLSAGGQASGRGLNPIKEKKKE